MARLWIDSFDDRTGGDVYHRYEEVDSQGTLITSTGRTGNCLEQQLTNKGGFVCKNIPRRQTVIVGFACRLGSSVSAAQQVLALRHGAIRQVYIRIETDATLTLLRGDGVQLGASAAEQVLSGTWAYVELKVTVSATSGVAVLRVNGADWVSVSGVRTLNEGLEYVDKIHIGNFPQGADSALIDYDDLYVCDDQEGVNDDFLGAVKIYCLRPNAVGNASDWTPNTGTAWQCVDDATPDDDTTYISTTSVGARELFAHEALSASGDPLIVAFNARSRKDALAARSYQAVFRHASTDSNMTTSAMSDTYRDDQWALDKNPVTGLAWTQTDVDNLQIGVRLSG